MAKVIVIDDSLSVCFAIERMLRSRGMEVISHRSGEAALEGLEPEEPDLVLCDLVLPDIEGFQICTFIKQSPVLADVPVIVISGIVDEEVRAQAKEVGAEAVLKKPFASDEMLTLVEKILRRRGVLKPDEDDVPTGPVAVEAEDATEPVEVEKEAEGEDNQVESNEVELSLVDSPAEENGESTASDPRAGRAPRILLATTDPLDAQPTVDAPDPLAQTGSDDELLDRLELRLEPLASIEALRFACILSPGGELRGYGPAKPTSTDLAALPQLMRAASNTATHTRQGEVGILTLETSQGVLVVKPQEEGHLMVLGLGDRSVLGKARYLLRRLEDS